MILYAFDYKIGHKTLWILTQ